MADANIRCFISLVLPKDVKQELARIQGRFKTTRIHGSWPKTQGFHVTLAFLGDQPLSVVSGIQTAINDAVQTIPRFQLRLDSPGAFPNIYNPKVLWIGLGGQIDWLTRLQNKLILSLKQNSIRLNKQKFSPHITIGRIKGSCNGLKVKKIASEFDNYRGDDFLIRDIHCYESQLTPSGAVHSRLFTASLGNND